MSSHKCKDHYVDCDDGSKDKICTVCGLRAKQGVMTWPPMMDDALAPKTMPLTQSIIRETIPIHMGGYIGTVDVYQDRLIEEINKGFKIGLKMGSG